MTEQQPQGNKIPSWVWIVLVVGIVVSLIVGCAIGAVGGFLAGRASENNSLFGMRDSLRATQTPEVTTPPQPRNRSMATPQAPITDQLAGSVVAVIRTVVEGTPAEKAGLKAGDFITAVDGAKLSEDVTLSDLIAKHKPGDTVTLTLGGRMINRTRSVEVTLGQHPDDPTKAYLGIEYSQFAMPDISNWQQDQDSVN